MNILLDKQLDWALLPQHLCLRASSLVDWSFPSQLVLLRRRPSLSIVYFSKRTTKAQQGHQTFFFSVSLFLVLFLSSDLETCSPVSASNNRLANCSVGGAVEAELSLGASAMIKSQSIVILGNMQKVYSICEEQVVSFLWSWSSKKWLDYTLKERTKNGALR